MKKTKLNNVAEINVQDDAPSAIGDVEEQAVCKHQAQELIARIRQAFTGVKLGDGVGLWQAQGLDDYASEEQCAQYRQKDEKEDWSRISANDLNFCSSSLSFFDAQGMRFHLPAYLIAELQGAYRHGMAFPLCYLSDYTMQQYALLTNEQKSVVCDMALYLADHPDYEFDRAELLKAVEEYWAKPGLPVK